MRSGEDTLSLRLRAAGYGRSLQPVAAAAPAAHANRVSYRRGSLTEWYANGPLGLEQGFTLKALPTRCQDGPADARPLALRQLTLARARRALARLRGLAPLHRAHRL